VSTPPPPPPHAPSGPRAEVLPPPAPPRADDRPATSPFEHLPWTPAPYPPRRRSPFVPLGLVLGALVLMMFMVRPFAELAQVGRAIGEQFGPVDADDYDLTVTSCGHDRSPRTVARGTLTNRTDSPRSFQVMVSFVDADRQVVAQAAQTTARLEPGEAARWTAMGVAFAPSGTAGSGRLECETTVYRNVLDAAP
jgi:hypothetical protein